jgi:hypothetical protein
MQSVGNRLHLGKKNRFSLAVVVCELWSVNIPMYTRKAQKEPEKKIRIPQPTMK